MRGIRWLHRLVAFCWIIGSGLLGVVVPNTVLAACARTPAAAAGIAGPGTPFSVAGGGDGFRVKSTRWDPVLRQRWAQIVSCAHPEWPTVELEASSLQIDPSPSLEGDRNREESLLPLMPVIRAGDVVQLWSQEGDLRIEVGAIAEQNAGMGKTVRVRLLQRKTLGQQVEEQFLGVVRGPHNVEMQQ